ncbi:amidase [Phlyctema vagabunda]|uniref:Amidase n=1 Tax=Phlyctema vagabunda TaxID=108571 RepID=A0ABR4PBG7_9HELO
MRSVLFIAILFATILQPSDAAPGHFARTSQAEQGSGCPSIGNNFNKTLPNLNNATLQELNAGLSHGQFTSVQLVEAYLARIQEVNPILKAVTEINPDALTIAKGLDEERKHGLARSPLHGIPILLKNNIATLDSMNNTAGSYALLGTHVSSDSTVAARLRQAGVILLGKANMNEWAAARGNGNPDGWSAYGGQCTGAYRVLQDPAGSSSGSAVAVSIGLAFAALGTDTSGSIVLPAGQNNVVGIRPTSGLTSRAGVIPFSLRQDSVGPLAQTVWDAASILDIIVGADRLDNYTLANPNPAIRYTTGLNQTPEGILKNARIGIPANVIATATLPEFNVLNSTQPILDSFELAAQLLGKAGAAIVANSTYSAWFQFLNESDATQNVAASDFRANLGSYLSRLPGPAPRSLEEITNFTQSNPLEEYPSHSTSTFELALDVPANDGIEIWTQYQRNLFLSNEGGPVGALDRDNLDAIILPSVFAPILSDLGGLPIVSVPLGFYPIDQPVWDVLNITRAAPGIPYGLSFIGRKWSEKKLIELAYAFEQLSGVRKQGVPVIFPQTVLGDIVGK